MLDRVLVLAGLESPGTAPVCGVLGSAGGAGPGRTGVYIDRPGFVLGGGGVAAVWWGGAVSLLKQTIAHLMSADPDQHTLAHLGELHALLAASHALLRDTAEPCCATPRMRSTRRRR
jgi:hypothetical protein